MEENPYQSPVTCKQPRWRRSDILPIALGTVIGAVVGPFVMALLSHLLDDPFLRGMAGPYIGGATGLILGLEWHAARKKRRDKNAAEEQERLTDHSAGPSQN